MPAPLPGNIEFNVGLAQWGAETEEAAALNETEMLATLLEMARALPAARTKAAMCETLASAAQVHDLPVGFFVRLINQESGFNPEVVSPAGAQGVAQFMPAVAQEWGLSNPFDPHAALVASARFLRSLHQQFGNWGLAAAAYNGGMGRVQKWIDKRGKLPDETRHYVKTITGVPAEQWVNGKPQSANFSIPARAPCQEIAHLADTPAQVVPLPVSRPQFIAGSPSRTTNVAAVKAPAKTANVTVIKVKGGTKLAVINVKPASKVAAVKGKIAQPQSIIANAAAVPKDKAGKAGGAVKVAQKPPAKSDAKAGAKPQAKVQAKSQDKVPEGKQGKERVRVADARSSRK